jgi:hypothetical protein
MDWMISLDSFTINATTCKTYSSRRRKEIIRLSAVSELAI